jgi:DNA-binding CsgD family transcriptional regulator
MLWHSRVSEGAEALDSAITRLAGQPDDESKDEARVIHAWLASFHPPLASVRTGETWRSRPSAPLTVQPRLQSISMLASVLTSGSDPDVLTDALDGAEQVLLGSQLTDGTIDQMEWALLALIYSDRLDAAASWCNTLLDKANQRRAPWWQATFAALRAEVSMRQGDMVAAEGDALMALTQVDRQQWGLGFGMPLATRLMAATAMGRFDVAAGHLNQPVDEAMFQSRYGLHYLHARGNYYLATRRTRAALGDFQACGALMERWGMDLPTLVPWRSEAARALVQLDRRDEARQLVLEQLSLVDKRSARTRGISLRALAAATSDLRQRPQILREAVDLLQASGDRFELSRALADISQSYQALGEAKHARATMRRAYYISTACGALATTQALLHRPARDSSSGGSPVSFLGMKSADSLSGAERRVAGLAVMGHTNQEIARRLHITVSTVEQHLTRVYRKLEVTRRSDLPSWLMSNVAGATGQ